MTLEYKTALGIPSLLIRQEVCRGWLLLQGNAGQCLMQTSLQAQVCVSRVPHHGSQLPPEPAHAFGSFSPFFLWVLSESTTCLHCGCLVVFSCSHLRGDGNFGLNCPTIGELQSRIGFLGLGYSVLGRAGEDIGVAQRGKYPESAGSLLRCSACAVTNTPRVLFFQGRERAWGFHENHLQRAAAQSLSVCQCPPQPR